MNRQILMCCVQYDAEIKSGKLGVADMAPIAKRLGLDGVEYREVYWHDKAKELPIVRDQLVGLGLRGTFATFTTLFQRDPVLHAQLLDEIADAKALGSSLIRIFRGELPGEGDGAMWDRAREALERAGELGLTVAMENYARTPGNRLVDVLGAIEAFASPILGTNVDVANYVQNDQEPIAAIRALSKHVRYVHLKDVKSTSSGLAATWLGNGHLPYGEILAALDATGQNFPLCFEFGGEGDPEGVIAKSRDYLRSLS